MSSMSRVEEGDGEFGLYVDEGLIWNLGLSYLFICFRSRGR